MSLLEDVFLEDEAGEAQDLERIIEGDGYDDQQRNSDDDDDGNAEGRDDEAKEDKRRVDPNSTATKKVVKNPRFVLNPARLTGPRGIQVIPEHFKNFKFKGKGHEKEDLDMVLKKLEHWAYRLYPKFKFEDCLKKMEMLGKKRTVMVHLHKIRSDQITSEETITQKDSSDDEGQDLPPAVVEAEEDEFDKLLQQQIELAHTPAGKRALGSGSNGDIGTPMSMPKATSSPSISEEQKQRMLQNRAMAEQRRLAKLKQVHGSGLGGQAQKQSVDLTVIDENVTKQRNKDGDRNNLTIDAENSKIINVDDQENNIIQESSVDLTNEDNFSRKSKKNSLNSNLNENSNDIEPVVDLTEKTDLPVSRKRKSYIYDDSDDDGKLSDDESISFNNDTDISVTKKTDFSKKVDKTVFNDDNTVDLTEIVVKQSKRVRKANIIDSSDEECDVTAEDVSITVDIHRENPHSQKGKVSIEKNDLTNELTLAKYQNNLSSEDIDDSIKTNYEQENVNKKQMNIAVSATKNCKVNETNDDDSKKQKDIDVIETSASEQHKNINETVSQIEDSTNKTNASLKEEEKHIKNIAIRDKKIDSNKTNEVRSEKQKNIDAIETKDDRFDEDVTKKNKNRYKKQKNIDEIETKDDQIDENMTEMRSDLEFNTTSDNIVNVFMEKQASNRIKESVDSTKNVQRENEISNNETSLAEENLLDGNNDPECVGNMSDGKIVVDDVMDVDFSEEF